MASRSVTDPTGASGGRVVVTGAAGALGRRVVALLAADPDVRDVVAIDRAPQPAPAVGVVVHRLDLAKADLKPVFEGASVVLHLAQTDGPAVADTASEGDGALAHRVLEAAAAVGVEHAVLLSSATVYGAWRMHRCAPTPAWRWHRRRPSSSGPPPSGAATTPAPP
jgi:nucleoside-diphosphate-sugar epimerase